MSGQTQQSTGMDGLMITCFHVMKLLRNGFHVIKLLRNVFHVIKLLRNVFHVIKLHILYMYIVPFDRANHDHMVSLTTSAVTACDFFLRC